MSKNLNIKDLYPSDFCVFKRLIDQADQLENEYEFELAAQKFDEALTLMSNNPDHKSVTEMTLLKIADVRFEKKHYAKSVNSYLDVLIGQNLEFA